MSERSKRAERRASIFEKARAQERLLRIQALSSKRLQKRLETIRPPDTKTLVTQVTQITHDLVPTRTIGNITIRTVPRIKRDLHTTLASEALAREMGVPTKTPDPPGNPKPPSKTQDTPPSKTQNNLHRGNAFSVDSISKLTQLLDTSSKNVNVYPQKVFTKDPHFHGLPHPKKQ